MATVVQEQKRLKTSDNEGGHEDEAQGNESSSDEEDENMDDWPIVERRVTVTPEEYDHYLKEAIKSRGFDVPSAIGAKLGGGIMAAKTDGTYRELMIELSKQALEEYNSKNENARFEFVDLVKANIQCVAGRMFYITFNAKDTALSNDTCQTFRAKVWNKLLNKGNEVKFCETI